MGERAKTYERIVELEKQKKELDKQISGLKKWIGNLLNKRGEICIEISECEGYLLELDSIDITDPYSR